MAATQHSDRGNPIEVLLAVMRPAVAADGQGFVQTGVSTPTHPPRDDSAHAATPNVR